MHKQLLLCVSCVLMSLIAGVSRHPASAQGLVVQVETLREHNAALERSLGRLEGLFEAMTSEVRALRADNVALALKDVALDHRLRQLEDLASAAAPSGAVLAFNLAECPEGWTLFASLQGRVVVGAGQGRGLTSRALADADGAEQVALANRNMPSHDHRYKDFFYSQNAEYGRDNGFSTQSLVSGQSTHYGAAGGNHNNVGWYQWRSTQSSGGNQSHENMPPFHVLTYCEKQ